MAALILPGQFASWQNGLVHAVWQGKELSEFSSVNGFAKTVTPAGEAIRLTGTQYMTRRLPAGFNFPLTFVSVFRRNVASPSRVLASVGSGTQRHLLYFASGNFLALYSAAGAATGQALGPGISDTANVYFAAGRVSSAASRDVFVNGVFYSPNTATANTTPMNVHAIGAYWNNDAPAAGFTSDADILFSGLWNRALSNAEILDLHQSWRRITRPAQRRIWVPVSGGGTAYSLSADVGSYSLSGQAAAFNYVPGAASYTLTADVGSYSLTGQAAGLAYAPGSGAYSLAAEFGSYSLSGVDASVKAGRNLPAEFGSYGLSGQAAGVVVGRRVAGEFGSYSLTGQDATLTAVGAVSYSLTAEVGLYSIDGQPVTLTGPETGGLTTAASGLIPKIWPLTVRYEGKRRRKHDQDEEKRIQEIAEEAVLQAAEEASKRAMKASIEASMKAAQLELAAATMDRLLKLAVKVHEEKMEEEELEMVLALL